MDNGEIRKILAMVKDGKISPEEGEKLILAVSGSGEKQSKEGKYLRISVGDEVNTMNFKIPQVVSMSKYGLNKEV